MGEHFLLGEMRGFDSNEQYDDLNTCFRSLAYIALPVCVPWLNLINVRYRTDLVIEVE